MAARPGPCRAPIRAMERSEIFAEGSTFTDDTVLTLATADSFLYGGAYSDVCRRFGRNYPYAGYSASFRGWLRSNDPQPYNSWGNGSAMRVSPIAWVSDGLDAVLQEAKSSAEVTHDHPNGIKGAQAVAAAVFLARTGESKSSIKNFVSRRFCYDLDRSLDAIRPVYAFDVSCEGSVPEAIIAFIESTDFESAIRKAISLGGDSDTIASIAGAVAHAYYGAIPPWMSTYCMEVLDVAQRSIIEDFWARYPASKGQAADCNRPHDYQEPL